MDANDLFANEITSFSLGCYLGTNYNQVEKVLANQQGFRFFEHLLTVPTKAAVDNGTLARNCPKCNAALETSQDRSRGQNIQWRFICASNHKFEPTFNTILSNARLNEIGADTIVKILFKWIRNDSVADSIQDCGSTKATVIFWYSRFRNISTKIAWHDYIAIGGRGDVVEIDETHLFRRKNNQGRLPATRAIWAFGGISRTSRKRFGFLTNIRDQNTLIPLLRKVVDPLSFICSDHWGAYNNVNQNFAGHGRVNHSINFIFPPRDQPPIWVPPGTFLPECLDTELNNYAPPLPNMEPIRFHTQIAENSWRYLKQVLRKCSEPRYAKEYLGEWMYRKNILETHSTMREKVQRFLDDCRRAYPGVGQNPMTEDYDMCDCHECH